MRDFTNPREEEKNRLAQEELLRLAKAREADDYQWLMSDARGRRLMWELLSFCGMYRTSFNSSGSVTAFNEGQRNVGLKLTDAINTHCPEKWLAMQQESKKK